MLKLVNHLILGKTTSFKDLPDNVALNCVKDIFHKIGVCCCCLKGSDPPSLAFVVRLEPLLDEFPARSRIDFEGICQWKSAQL